MTTQQILVNALDEAQAVELAIASVTPRSFYSSLRAGAVYMIDGAVELHAWTARTSKQTFTAFAGPTIDSAERWLVRVEVTAL